MSIEQIERPSSTFKHPRYEDFNTPLHLQWKRDRSLCGLLPSSDKWRACLGVGVLFDDVHPLAYDGRLIYPSDSVTFFANRDIPSRDDRNVSYCSKAKASLRYGAPVIRFDQDLRSAVDFQMMPCDKAITGSKNIRPDVFDATDRVGEFALLNRISEEMTKYAFCAVDKQGKQMRPLWHRIKRQLGKMTITELSARRLTRENVKWLTDVKPFQVPHPRQWLPRPMLRFSLAGVTSENWVNATFDRVTESCAKADVYECPECLVRHDSQEFGLHDDTGLDILEAENRLGLEFLDDGRFLAWAPCGCRGKTSDGRMIWHPEDALPGRFSRNFTPFFKGAFCDAVADGLSFKLLFDCRYVARDRVTAVSDHGGVLDVNAYRFTEKGANPRRFTLYAPCSLKIKHKLGAEFSSGEVFFSLAKPAGDWLGSCLELKWYNLFEVLGGGRWVSFFLRQWFANQAIMLPGNEVAMPFALLGTAAKDLHPAGLSWDFGHLTDRMDAERKVCVLPALELSRWNKLRRKLPFDIELDARVFDPRFSEEPRELPFEAVEVKAGDRPIELVGDNSVDVDETVFYVDGVETAEVEVAVG